MGLLSSIMGSAISAAVNSAIGRSGSTRSTSTSRTPTKTTSGATSGYSSGGGATSNTTPGGNAVYNMRNYMSGYGKTPGYDSATGTVTIGGNSYQNGSIPGTYFDKGTGTHYVTDPTSFNSILGVNNPTTPDQPQQSIMAQPEDVDTTAYINQLKEAQRQSRISALDKARNTALSSLDTEKANIAPTYYDKRNQAAANSDVGAMNFANYMAARGIKGAAGAMPEIYRNAGLQGQLGALDRQEASELGAIERQRANVETGYASDVASANADVESQAMQELINQYNANRTYALQKAAQDWDVKKGTLTLAKDKEDAAKKEWISTIGQYNNDYQAQIDAVKNDGDTSNDWQLSYLQAARQKKLAEQQAAAAKAAQQDIDNQQEWARINKTGSGGGGGKPTVYEQEQILLDEASTWASSRLNKKGATVAAIAKDMPSSYRKALTGKTDYNSALMWVMSEMGSSGNTTNNSGGLLSGITGIFNTK